MSENKELYYPITSPPQPPHFNNSFPKPTYSNIIRIPNINQYTQEIIHGNLVLTPKKDYIIENENKNENENKLKMVQFTNSSTIECYIKEEKKPSYNNNNLTSQTIYIDIWKSSESQLVIKMH